MTLRLFLLQPTSIHTARVNQSSFTYPLGEVTYDGGTAIGTARDNQTVLFGTSAGDDDLGRTRVRDVTGIGASGQLKIGRSSQGIRDGEVKLEDDAYITLLDDFRVWARIPFIDSDGNIFKDHDLTVGDKTGADTPPVANIGAGFAATIDSGTSLITASWDASTNSFAVADGESISSYLWDVDDGTITSGTTTTEGITATFPAGFRWVQCAVTDSNSQTHVMRVPVYARDPASDTTISAFNIDAHRITPEGQQISLRITEAISAGTYPDGTLVMIWEDEPAGAGDRSHMIFIGWHHNDPATIGAQRTGIVKDTVLECLDVTGKLDTLPGFTQSIYGEDSPSTWSEMASPNMDKYLHYLLQWHSTALEIADWTDSGTGSNFPFVILGSDGESLWDQVQRRAKALVPDYMLTCNTLGQLATTVDPMLQDTGDRTGTIQVTLVEADWSNIQYAHQRPPRVHWLRGDAIKTSSTNISALFCVAPGTAPGQGEIEQQSSEQLAQSQSDLNKTEGHRYARINAPEGLFNIVLTAGDDQDIEPADLTWVRLNISSDTAAQRGMTFTDVRGLVQEINIRYEHARTGLARTVELRWEREVDGVPAITYTQPEDDIPDPEFPPLPPGDYDPDPGETPGSGFGTAYVFLSNKLVRTRDLSVTSPTWTDLTGSVTGTSYDWILDPWNPITRGFALTSNGAWRADGLDGGGAPTWTQLLTQADVATATGETFSQFWYKIQGSINIQDYIGLWATTFAAGDFNDDHFAYYIYSSDAGASWNYTKVATSTGFIGGDGFAWIGGGWDIVPHTIGGSLTIYAGIVRRQGEHVWKSSDAGASWANVGSFDGSPVNDGPACINTPYENNEDGLTVWLSLPAANSPIGGPKGIYKSTDGFASSTKITLPGQSDAETHTRIKRLGIEIYIGDQDRISIWARDATAGSKLFISSDGSTFSEISYSGYVPGTHGDVGGAGGFPYNGSQLYIITKERHLFISIDGGVNWIEKTGDLQSIISSDSGSFFGLAVIVPVWVAE